MVKMVSTVVCHLVLAEEVLPALGLHGVSHMNTGGDLDWSRFDTRRNPVDAMCRRFLLANLGKLEKLAIVAIGRSPYTPSPPPWEGLPQLLER